MLSVSFLAPPSNSQLPPSVCQTLYVVAICLGTRLLVVACQFEAGNDVHGLQLLEEQFAGVGYPQRGHVTGGLTVVAPGDTHIKYFIGCKHSKNLQLQYKETEPLVSSSILTTILRYYRWTKKDTHHPEYPSRPHWPHTSTSKASLEIMRRSSGSMLAP